MRTGSKVVLIALALAVGVAGCGGRPTEDVRATVDGSQLVLENRSNTDIHFQLIQPLTAFIPLSTPLNRLEDGRTLKLRIAPSQRGETIDMAWWRPGDRIDGSEIRGPDRVRKIRVKLVGWPSRCRPTRRTCARASRWRRPPRRSSASARAAARANSRATTMPPRPRVTA